MASFQRALVPPSRQLATSGYSVVGAVCELDPVHHSPGSDGVQCTTGVITHVQPCMTISKVSSFQRLFHHPCRGSRQFRCDPSCWSSGVVLPRAARTGATHKFGGTFDLIITGSDGHRISRSWSTWHHLRPRFGVLLYTHTVICSQAIRSSSKLPEAGGEWTERLSSKQSGTVLSAVLLNLRTTQKTIGLCRTWRSYRRWPRE